MSTDSNSVISGLWKFRLAGLACLLRIILCILALPAIAQAGDYTYTTADSQITITGYSGTGGAVAIPGTIDSLPVTRIADSAFYCLSKVTSVEVPSGVVSIGVFAFAACGNLISVTIPSTVKAIDDGAFYYNAKLTSVNIPEGVLTLGDNLFTDCPALTTITIPASVTSMGTEMFQRCGGVTSATILANVPDVGTNAFEGCTSLTSVTLPSGITRMPNYVFSGCAKLASVTIPPGVTSIGDGAFSGCHLLPAITIPSGVTGIGNYAFQNCHGMTDLTILGVQTIGYYAFSGCWKLTNVSFPAGLTSIGEYAFSSCTSLASVTFPAGVTRIGHFAFFSCTSLANVTIPASVTSIGVAVFARCERISTFTVEEANPNYRSVDAVLYDKSMTRLMTFPGARAGRFNIPDGVATIDSMAFSTCGNLTGVTMPASVTSIGESAFSTCPLLENVIIPASVTGIGPYAFLNCGKLSGVLFQGNAPSIGSSAFDSAATGFTIYYQQGATGFALPLWMGYPAMALSSSREIVLRGPAGEILTDGSSATDFGYLLPGASASKTFIISNGGAVPLTGVAIGVDGTAAGDFTVGNPATTALAPGMSTTFTVTFTAGPAGSRNAVLHVLSDDADESPFDIGLSGICTPTPVAEITVFRTGYGTLFEDGISTLNLGTAGVGTFVVTGITVKNSGTGDMHGLAITLDGGNSADFSFNATPPAILAPGASFSCTVKFSPSSVGNRNAQLHITSDDPDENPFDLNLGAIAVPPPAPEIAVEPSSGPGLLDGVSVIAFEPVPLGTQSATQTFTIRNQGNAYLQNLSITKDGPDPLDFVVSNLSKTTLTGGESMTLTVGFSPLTIGNKGAVIHITSNDADENPFDIQLSGACTTPPPVPEISVWLENTGGLANGSATIDLSSKRVGESVTRNIIVQNFGTADLKDLAITVEGANAADFSASIPPSTVITPWNGIAVPVTFSPSAIGARSAKLHIASNDPDENPFDIDLSGTGLQPNFPEIVVNSPSGAGLTDGGPAVSFGTITLPSTVVKTFTIRNEGDAELGNLSVRADGPDAAHFLINPLTTTALAAGESTNINVTFRPDKAGIASATLHVVSNDADENPFDIPLAATVLTSTARPEIDVQQPAGKSLRDGASLCTFGAMKVKSSSSKVFTIRNLGKVNLAITSLKKTGPHAKDFIITPPAETTVEPGAATKFKVTFKPSATGIRKATIHIKSGDANETYFDIDLTGKGVASSFATPGLAASDSRMPSAFIAAPNVSRSVESIHGLRYLTLSVPKPSGAAFEYPVVEVSPDLVEWYSGSRHTTVETDNAVRYVVRDKLPVTQGAKRHIRIKPTQGDHDRRPAVRRP